MLKIQIAGAPGGRALLQILSDRLTAAGYPAPLHMADFPAFWSSPAWWDCELLIAGGVGCDRAKMLCAPNLKAILSPFIGIDGIDVDAATELGIAVANGQVTENSESMAEAAIMLMLASLYKLHDSERLMNIPKDEQYPTSARMLKGKFIGVIGYGKIARALIERLSGWQTHIQVYSRHAAEHEMKGAVLVELDNLLETSDIVIVASELSPATFHLLDANRINQMKRSALLINISRGGIIDQRALIDALQDGRLAQAALDVFEVEPLPIDSPLRHMSNVILTPHCVGHTIESQAAIVENTICNVINLFHGRLPPSVINGQSSSLKILTVYPYLWPK